MLVAVTAPAEADLDDIVSYLAERNPAAALRTRETILDQLRLLSDYPWLGRPGRIAGTRELVIAHTPYIVPYTVDLEDDVVYVLRVFHGAKMWPQSLEDEP